jgi:hypothetical protein
MSEITIKIDNLDITNTEMSEIDDNLLNSLSGSGPIAGFAAGFGTTLGIGLYGLSKGQSTQSIWEQQVFFGGAAFIGGLLTPGP